MSAIGTKKSPVHPLAVAAFLISIAAIALAFYGSMAAEAQIAHSPLNRARGAHSAAAAPATRYTLEFIAFVLPLLLGLAAALTGGVSMRKIELAQGKYRGDAVSVFAIFLGGFAAVIGGCMSLAFFGWRFVPALYTV